MANIVALIFIFSFIRHKANCEVLVDNKHVDCNKLGNGLKKAIDLVVGGWSPQSYSGVGFRLSTRKNVELLPFSTHIDLRPNSIFKIERPTVIIIHGYLASAKNGWMKEMKDALLEWNDVNVMLIDWSSMASAINYVSAAISTKTASMEITRILTEAVESLGDKDGRSWGPIHIIGHSLGAQIGGRVARSFNRQNFTWKVTRVTGLDPASPCFAGESEYSLNKNDAAFVDVIHTNAKPLSELGLGVFSELGHIDFYPNGGMAQRGCEHLLSDVDSLCFPIITGISRTAGGIYEMICNHGRSYDYFTESIFAAARSKYPFWGHRWNKTFNGAISALLQKCDGDTCPKMGILADESQFHGPFYVFTQTSSPFSMSEDTLRAMVKKALHYSST